MITVGDMVEVHAELARHLGRRAAAGRRGREPGGNESPRVGGPLPIGSTAAIVLAWGANLSAQGIAFQRGGPPGDRLAIPSTNGGKFYGEGGPRFGLALARMVAHITYLSEESIEQKFGRRLQDAESLAYNLLRETEFQVESYLHYQGKRFVERFDANSYLYLTKAMDYFNLAKHTGA